MPTAPISVPATGNSLYRPVWLMIRPVEIDVPIAPSISGTIVSPDSVAVAPVAICMNSGR